MAKSRSALSRASTSNSSCLGNRPHVFLQEQVEHEADLVNGVFNS